MTSRATLVIAGNMKEGKKIAGAHGLTGQVEICTPRNVRTAGRGFAATHLIIDEELPNLKHLFRDQYYCFASSEEGRAEWDRVLKEAGWVE